MSELSIIDKLVAIQAFKIGEDPSRLLEDKLKKSTMQIPSDYDISTLADTELVLLSEEMKQKYFKLEQAKQGVLTSLESLKPLKPQKPKALGMGTPIYSLQVDISHPSLEFIQKVQKLLTAEVENIFELKFHENYYTKYLSQMDSKAFEPAINKFYPESEILTYEKDLKEYKNRIDLYEKEQAEYAKQKQKENKINYCTQMYFDKAYRAIETEYNHIKTYTEFLDITDGNHVLASSFFKKTYDTNIWNIHIKPYINSNLTQNETE